MSGPASSSRRRQAPEQGPFSYLKPVNNKRAKNDSDQKAFEIAGPSNPSLGEGAVGFYWCYRVCLSFPSRRLDEEKHSMIGHFQNKQDAQAFIMREAVRWLRNRIEGSAVILSAWSKVARLFKGCGFGVHMDKPWLNMHQNPLRFEKFTEFYGNLCYELARTCEHEVSWIDFPRIKIETMVREFTRNGYIGRFDPPDLDESDVEPELAQKQPEIVEDSESEEGDSPQSPEY